MNRGSPYNHGVTQNSGVPGLIPRGTITRMNAVHSDRRMPNTVFIAIAAASQVVGPMIRSIGGNRLNGRPAPLLARRRRQDLEPGLTEVPIGREGLPQAKLAHDHEAGAVGEREPLVAILKE